MSFRLPLSRSPSRVRSWRCTEVGVYQARRGLKTSDHWSGGPFDAVTEDGLKFLVLEPRKGFLETCSVVLNWPATVK
jgi:hypothetical protein